MRRFWRIILTRYNAFLLITFLIIFIIGATTSLIAFTNLREFIPGYPDVTMRRNILMSAIRLDSLDRELALRDKYFENLNAIISGNQPVEMSVRQDTTKNYKAIKFKTSPEDSALRARSKMKKGIILHLDHQHLNQFPVLPACIFSLL